ncbi:MAG: outer membrane beta-barrel protein [Flavobacteriales bacterium]|nr:outer membrane beta-barrel protein [Flavobacteriales bacterium]
MADQENIDDLFKSELENKSVKAPAGAWSGIEAGMQARQRSKRGGYLIAAAILLLLGTSGLSFWLGLKSSSNKEIITKTIKDTVYIEKIITKEIQTENNMSKLSEQMQSENAQLKHELAHKENLIRSLNETNSKLTASISDLQEAVNDQTDSQNNQIYNDLNFSSDPIGLMLTPKSWLGPGILKRGPENTELAEVLSKKKSFSNETSIAFFAGQDFLKFKALGYVEFLGAKDDFVQKANNFHLGMGVNNRFHERFEWTTGLSYNCRVGEVSDNFEKTYYYTTKSETENEVSPLAAYADAGPQSYESFTNLEDELNAYQQNNLIEDIDSAGNIVFVESSNAREPQFRTKYKVQYIDIPLTLRYYPIVNRNVEMHTFLGVSGAIFSSMNKVSEINDVSSIFNEKQTPIQHFASFNALAGLGVHYKVMSNWDIGLSYQLSHTFRSKRHNFLAEEFRTHSVRLGLRYRLK